MPPWRGPDRGLYLKEPVPRSVLIGANIFAFVAVIGTITFVVGVTVGWWGLPF